MHHSEGHESEYAVAIVGLACRFPGAADADQFWRNLKNGVESITFFTDEELLRSGEDPSLLKNPAYIRAKGVLEEIEMFDASFFSVPPREAEIMDPQHRLFLECAWEALENAACNPERYEGRIGVYSGTGSNGYLIHHLLPNPELLKSVDPFQLLLSNQPEFAPARTSYKLNLTGPSLNLGTSCSTSLAAVYMACQGLLNYQCDLALAGGVRLDLPQRKGYLYHEGGVLSPDGHCRPFDAAANGTVSGSGVGMVVLKRLAEALENGDPIYAVIRGGAMNNDGASKAGFAAPSVSGQAEVIAEALDLAGVTADTIGYVEAHGTATPMGDPIELRALTRAFRLSTEKTRYCAVGSVKGNIGHLDAAAGMASIIKTALVLKHGILPPSLHFKEPNPEIDFESSPFYVQARLEEWKAEGVRRAGVSAFGVGGTNVHLVLEESPEPLPRKSNLPDRKAHLLAVSAKSTAALNRACVNLARFLKENPQVPLADVACTLSLGRRSFPIRRTIVCGNAREASAELRRFEENPTDSPPGGQDSPFNEKTVEDLLDALAPDPPEHSKVREVKYRILMEALGKRWVQGASVDWTRLYPAGAHRFVPLPAYPFERQAYWIEAGRQEKNRRDISGKNPDPAQWFYLPSWRRTLAPSETGRPGKPDEKTWLLFLDESDESDDLNEPGCAGPGALLARRMRERGGRVILIRPGFWPGVRPGDGFERIGEHTFTLSLQGEEGYRALFDELERTGSMPDEIVHLWTLTRREKTPPDSEEIRNRGFFSLLALARTLGKRPLSKPVTITLITDGMEELTGLENLIPEKSTLLGPARVIPQEYPQLSCRVLDIVPPEQESGWQALAARLEKELYGQDLEPLVALRGNHRWVPHPDKVLLEADRGVLPLREEGVYLITGGLGAIGMCCAGFLARNYRARLALIGRSGPDERIRKKIDELEKAGGKVLTLQADVADEEEMRTAICRTEDRFGPIHGVIHGAGVTGEKAFRTLAETRAEECLEQLRPKVLGTRVLSRLLAGRSLDFFLLHSSLSAVLGGLGFASYAAGNLFLDAFARVRNRTSGFPWISIDWEGWQFQETRAAAPLDKNLTAYALHPEEGLEALKRVLCSRATHFAVSTGDLPARMEKWRRVRSAPLPAGSARPAHARPDLDTPYAAPGNEIEEKLLAIWQELFGIEKIGIHDDFFRLNGDSVLAAQAASRIRDEFDIDMPLPVMFDRPTVCRQAEFVLEAKLNSLRDDALGELFAEVDRLSETEAALQIRKKNE